MAISNLAIVPDQPTRPTFYGWSSAGSQINLPWQSPTRVAGSAVACEQFPSHTFGFRPCGLAICNPAISADQPIRPTISQLVISRQSDQPTMAVTDAGSRRHSGLRGVSIPHFRFPSVWFGDFQSCHFCRPTYSTHHLTVGQCSSIHSYYDHHTATYITSTAFTDTQERGPALTCMAPQGPQSTRLLCLHRTSAAPGCRARDCL